MAQSPAATSPGRGVAPAGGGSRLALAGIIAAVVVVALVLLLPAPSGMSPPAHRMSAIFLAALILWSTEALPVAITAILFVAIQPVFGVATVQGAITSFMSPVFFFVVSMFCVARALAKSGLAARFARWMIARADGDSRRLVLGFVLGTGWLSTIMADVPACAMALAIALDLLERLGLPPGQSRLGKAIMMGIPIAALVGGVGTPAGGSVNILGMYFIEQYGKFRVPFLSWTAIGIPMVAVLLPVVWWALMRFCPPEVDRFDTSRLDAAAASPARLSAGEWKTLAILAAMMVLWVLNTWYAKIDIVLVGMAGAVAMFLPGIRLLEWREAERHIGWEAVFMIGGVTSLGAASVDTGVARWIVDSALGNLQQLNAWQAIGVISAFTVVVHLVLPIAPVVNAVLIPPIVLLATSSGHNPAFYALPVAFTASCAFLLPLDAVSLITYSRGYYRMWDMFLPGLVVSIAWVIAMTALMVIVAPMVGLL